MVLALSLTRRGIPVAIIEKNKKSKLSNINDLRTSAISQGSSRILTNLNIIKKILLNKNLFPIHHSLIVMFYPNFNKNNVYNFRVVSKSDGSLSNVGGKLIYNIIRCI